jgi:hypothetical protein
VTLGKGLGAAYFEVPTAHWNKMTADQQWAANQKFLDRAINRGDVFQLATPIEIVRPASALAKEIAYILSKNYTLSPGKSFLIPAK